MRKIINGIEFCRRELYDCTQQASDVVLQFYGYKVEDILFDEWRFFYIRGKAGTVQISPGPLDIGRNFSDYGVSLLLKRAADAKEAWSAMKHLIDEGKPTPALADAYYLDYYSPENRHHAPHYVILVGYDEEQGTVHIVDPSPWQLFKGDISLGDFKSALDSSYFHNAKRNLWLEFEFPAQSVGHTPDALRAKMRRNVEEMLEGRRDADILGEMEVFWGMEGVRTFAQDVEGWASMEKEVLIGHMKACFDGLKKVACRLDGHAHFLASAGETLESRDLNEISFEVGKLAQSWFLPGNMFFKGSKKDPLAMLPRIHRRLLDIADKEEQVLIALKEAIET